MATLATFAVPVTGFSAPTLSDVQSQASAAKAKLAGMQGKVAQGVAAYSSASSDLATTRAQISANKDELKKVQASLKAGQESLSTQAEFLYRTDGAGFVDVLLGSASFEEFATRLSVLQTIASKDAGLVSGLKTDKAEQQSIIATLQSRESRQQTLVAKVAAQRDALQSQLDSEQSYYNGLSTQVSSLIAAAEQAAKAAKASSSSSGGGSVNYGGGSKPTPPSSGGGSVALKQVTISGKSGTWWAMASDHNSFSATGVKFSGGASVYSVADNGTGTSSGRPLNDHELTCAHKTLPFGTRVAISHDGHRIIAIVTDRGPYVSGRVLDLTPRGASLLGIDGVGDVSCEVVN